MTEKKQGYKILCSLNMFAAGIQMYHMWKSA